MNKWSKLLDIPFPECGKTGNCCKFSIPSSSCIQLLQKAANSDEFARDYLSIFIPYANIEQIKSINPDFVDKIKDVFNKNNDNKTDINDIVFYRCRFIVENNSCMIYEDRPTLCRSFPDSPFLVLPPGCAYEEWSKNCKEKYNKLKTDMEFYKKELNNLQYQRKAIRLLEQLNKIEDKYKPAFILPSLNLVSPRNSWLKRF